MNENTEKELVNKLAVPIYEDVVKPFGTEISKGLVSVARSVNSGIFLMEDCIQATANVLRMTGEQLALLPPSELSFDKPRVALQALDQAKYSVNEIEIQKLFSNLITSSLSKKTQNAAHPAFIEVIKQLDSDEALIIKFIAENKSMFTAKRPAIDVSLTTSYDGQVITSMSPGINLIAEDSGCIYPERSFSYLENLKRLGLVVKGSNRSFSDHEYERIFKSHHIEQMYSGANEYEKVIEITYKKASYHLTTFGMEFASTAIRT